MSIQGEIDRIAQNVMNTYSVLSALGADMPAEQNSDNLASTAGTAKTVLYSEQTLTDEQKAQARTNIGAASAAEVAGKMDKVSGAAGQVIGFDADGNPVAQETPEPDLSDCSTATNLVNGKAAGSLRGVNTISESSSYAIGVNATALGISTKAAGEASHAEGNGTNAVGNYTHAEGVATKAGGTASHAEGTTTTATGAYSHAEGSNTQAIGSRSHAEGNASKTVGADSHAEGQSTTAIGTASHAEGSKTKAVGSYAHAEGFSATITVTITGAASSKTYTLDSANTSIKVGQVIEYSSTYASITAYDSSVPSITVDKTLSSTALEGSSATIYRLVAAGNYSHAEGQGTLASGSSSHAEGVYTTASGTCAHAEGKSTTASGIYSHAEGQSSEATGDYSHAEGAVAKASGEASHAEGYSTKAVGRASHAEGLMTGAEGSEQHVQGKYNIRDTTSAHIVGNGTASSDQSNAHTLDWEGNAWFAGDVYVGSTSGTNKDAGSKKLATTDPVSGSTASAPGTSGLVPAPAAGDQDKFLKGDGTWATPGVASHNQAASTITAGTFAGQVVANASGQAVDTALLRNSKIVSADTNPTVNGEINWTYK